MPKRTRGAQPHPPSPSSSTNEDGDIETGSEYTYDASTASASASGSRPAKAARTSSRSNPAAASIEASRSESLDPLTTKKLARKERNRLSAASSRARKRDEDNELRARLESQEALLSTLTSENIHLKQENETLKCKVSGMEKLENELESIRERFGKLEQMFMLASQQQQSSIAATVGGGAGVESGGASSGSRSNQEVGSETHALACMLQREPQKQPQPSPLPSRQHLQHESTSFLTFSSPPVIPIPIPSQPGTDNFLDEILSSSSPSHASSIFLGSPNNIVNNDHEAGDGTESANLFADLDAVFGSSNEQQEDIISSTAADSLTLFGDGQAGAEQAPFADHSFVGMNDFGLNLDGWQYQQQHEQQQQEMFQSSNDTPGLQQGFDWSSYLQPQPGFAVV